MIFIIEGQRCTGKSHLIRHLVNEHGVRTIKFERQVGNQLEIMHQQLDLLEKEEGVWVLDRFHLTEFVMRVNEAKTFDDIVEATLKQARIAESISSRLRHGGYFTVQLIVKEDIRQQRLVQANREDEPNPDQLRILWEHAARWWSDIVLNTSDGTTAKRIMNDLVGGWK